jgi:photosystem II stability/assembly factor-like uncharacterized protein
MEQSLSTKDYVYCLAPSPNFIQDGLIFAAKQSGLYRSTDSGQNWDDAYAALKLEVALPTTFVTLIPQQENIFVFACVEGNVLRSTNGGDTWEFTELSSPPALVTSFVISPNFAEDKTLLAGTMQDGIFRSTSRGATWSGWNFGLFDPNVNALVISPNFAEDQTICAGTQSGIFRSMNGGRSWRDLEFPIDFAPVLSLALVQNKKIYAGTEDQGLCVSPDEGKAWNQLTEGSVDQILAGADDNLLIVKDGEPLFSKDGGKSWELRVGIETESTISSLAAPVGLGPEYPLWVGLSNGKVIKI